MTPNSQLRKKLVALFVCILILSACSNSKSAPKQAETNTGSGISQNTPVSTPIPPTLVSTPTLSLVVSEPAGCKKIHEISICVQEITNTDAETQVRLKIIVESAMVTGAGNSFIYSDDQKGIGVSLADDEGNSYSLVENADNSWAQFDDAENAYFQTLHFQPVPKNVKNLKVILPLVAVDMPVKAEGFQIDLGQNPQPGQTKTLDVKTSIDGQEFHFIKAEFGGDGVNSLLVTLFMEPLNLPDDVFWVSPAFGDPEKGIFFGQKFGSNQIFAELVVPPGKSSGLAASNIVSSILNLRADRITYWYGGPFEIVYQLP
jgi:hypothetical protein